MNKKGKQALTLVVVSLLGLLLLSLSASADPGVLYAAPNSAGSGNCASWENACTLQTALTGASSGDEIWVMAGTYKPAAGTDRTATFQLKDGVAVYGGFAGGETAREQRDPATNPTILSGDIDNNDSQTPVITDLTTVTGNTTNSYHVLKGAAGSTLDGFTITAGYANGSSPDNNGGGLHNTSTNLMLANVIFSGNSVNNNGGGIYNDGTLAVSNGTFSGNFATIYGASAGGAVYNYLYGTLTITNCTLLGNSATYGGGLSNQGTLTMTNSTLSSNRADWGSGINNYGTLTLTNSTLSGNLAASGFSLYNHLTLNYANTIIANSTAGDCAQYGTLGTNTNNLVEDGSCSAALSGDPNLGPLVDNGGLTWTLALLPGSSAVDAGNDILCPASDQRGVSRPQRAQCDIGAYEYDYTGIYYTKPAASGIGDCQSWANACSLLTALANTLTGDEIWAAAGTYKPTEGTDRTATFQLKNGVPVYGGFAGTETARDQRDWAANLTVLSGDIDQNDLTDPTGVVTSTAHITGTNSYHVVTSSGVTETAVLDGFVITAGWANGARPDDYGGGMLNSDYSSPMLTNVTFRGNLAVYGGGMLNLDYSSPMLTNVTFSSNRANYGGGMNNINSSPTLINVTFSSNLTYEGGGMYNTNSSPTLTNVTFDGNSAGEGAGAMYNYSNSHPTLTNVTFSNNAANVGGGMYNLVSHPTLTNVTFSDNRAYAEGGGMNNSYSSPTLTDVIFSNNSAANGGGMLNGSDSHPTLTNVTFSDNSASNRGGGIYNSNGSPTLMNVNFSSNSSSHYGGGMMNYGDPTLTNVTFSANSANSGGGMATNNGNPTLINVTFNSNSAAAYGGGMHNYSSSSPILTNVTFSANSADYGGGMNNDNSSPALSNVILWDNTAPNGAGIYNDASTPQISTSDIQGCGGSGSWDSACGADGGGNIDADPLFVDAANGNLRLQDASLAINAGDNAALPPGVLIDLDGNPRFVRVFVDMGAYENQTFPCPAGGVLYVDQDAAGAQTGESWEDALVTLQDALQVTEACEIWVKAGVYYPDQGGSQADNDRSTTFTLKNGVALYGGFGGTETARDERDWTANVTVLSGDIDQNDLTDPNDVVTNTAHITGTNAYHVVTDSGSDSSATLDGFFITGGLANQFTSEDGFLNYYGAGMYNKGNALLTNLTLSGNLAVGDGGGLYNVASPTLENVAFTHNAAEYGGGIFNLGNPSLLHVTFTGNHAGTRGGGMYNNGNPTLTNITFSGNLADMDGGGMFNGAGNPTLTNVILWGNNAPNGAGIYGSGTLQVSYSDIQGCGGSGNWNSACGVDGGGNIESDPLFVDALNGDLRLQDSSPVINAGDNDALPPGILTDLDGNPRFVRVFVDMGAYENQTFPCPAGGVLYVDQNATGDQTGASWDDALLTLQDALQVTEACEIWVAEGVYYPDEGGSQAEDDYRATFQLKNGVEIYGGFAGTETSRDQSDWQANPTVLSGDLEQDDVDLNGDGLLAYTETVGVNAWHVLVAENVTGTIRIEGLNIRSGVNASGDGAGMYLKNSLLHMQDVVVESNHAVNGGGIASIYSSVTLEGVAFLGNSATLDNTGGGGGLYLYGAMPGYWQNVNNVTFVGNRAGYAGGGGLRVQHSPFDVTNSAFISNTAISDYTVTEPVGGGGMVMVNAWQTTIADTLFRDNHAIGRLEPGDDIPERSFGNGGGLHVHFSDSELVRVTFQDNSAALGGGIYIYAHGEEQLSQVTFINNHAYYLGGGAYSDGALDPSYHQALFTHNRAPYCGALCGWNILADSVFAYNHAYDPNPYDTNQHGIGGALNGYPSKIINSAFYSNTADTYGPDLASWYAGGELINVTMASGIGCPAVGSVGSSMTIMNSIIHSMEGDCTVTFRHSIYGELNVTSVTDGGGNLPDVDPLFVDLANGNLRLQSASPAIDSGNTALATYGIGGEPILTDLDGNPRLVDLPTVPDTGSGPAPIVDMGAYEAQFVDVALGKAVLPPAAAPGEAITFTLAVSNTGSLSATGIVVTDSLPAWLGGVSFTSTLTLTDTGYLPPYAWQVQDLARGQGGVITISGVLTVPLPAGTYSNTALITATGDLLPENNTAAITFSVSNVAPVFTSTPLIAAMQDTLYTTTATAQDDNGDALTLTAPTLPGWLSLVDHGNATATLSGTPTNADVGEHPVVLRVTDGAGLFAEQTFTITVANVNDAPFFTSTPVTTATQGAPYSYAVAAGDPDLAYGDALTLTAPTLPAWLTLTDHGNGTATLSGTPTNADVGANTIVLRVTDSEGLVDTQAFTITVANVNDAPLFTSTPVTTATQGAPYTYAVGAGDPDLDYGDALTLTATTLPGWLSLVDHGNATATLSGTPTNADVGEHPVVLRVTDSIGLSDTQSFTITVANVNDAPFFTSTPVTTATQGAAYSYAVAAGDPDLPYGDALTISATTLPAWLTLTDHGNGTATLSGTPANTDVGANTVVLRVTDSGGLIDTQAFTITVANVNDAPFFTSTPVTTATQGAPYTYAVGAGDPDLDYGDALTLTATTLPDWLTLTDHGDGTATLSGTPSNADVGEHPVVLRVTDSAGSFAEQTFTLTVANVNDAPFFTSTPVTTATQGAPYTYAVAAGDPDLPYGDALTLTAPTLPSWLSLVDHGNGTATLSGTPTNADVGVHTVVLRVTDSGGLTRTQTFTITVANVNDAPFFTSTPVTTATENLLYTYAIAAGDPDLPYGDALTITTTTLPSWLTLTDHGDGTATLSGTPAVADLGDHVVVLLVTDSGGLNDTQSFTITVAYFNDAPAFTSAPVVSATQDAPYSYAVIAGDPDLIHGDALTLTATTLPTWLTFTDHGNSTATLSGTPTNAEVGEHAVVLHVTDSAGLYAEQAFTLTVANVNDAPAFTSAPVVSATQGAPYTYAVAAGDPDLTYGDALMLTAPTLPTWLTLTDHGNSTATLSGTPTNAEVGEHAVMLRVTDDGGLMDTQAFTITVSNVNDAPFFTSTPVTTATQGAPYTYAVTAGDPDLDYGDALTLTATTLPDWLTLTDHGDGTATLSGTPTNADVGVHPVVLCVTDGAGLFAEQTFTLTVANVNDAPAFTSAPIITATQGAPYSYAIAAEDPDLIHGDALTLTAPTLPTWLTLTDHGNGTATLSGTPTNAYVGVHPVVLRVTDGEGLTGTQAFTITVIELSGAPFFTSTPVTTATQGAPYTYTITADDPNLIHGDVLTLTAPTLPAWLTLTDHGNGTATLSGTPARADAGAHPVVLRVTDSSGLTATQTFTITVWSRVYLPLVLRNTP